MRYSTAFQLWESITIQCQSSLFILVIICLEIYTFCQTMINESVCAPQSHLQSIRGICLNQGCAKAPFSCPSCSMVDHLGHNVLTHQELLKLADEPPFNQEGYLTAQNQFLSIQNIIKKIFKNLLEKTSSRMQEEVQENQPSQSRLFANIGEINLRKIVVDILGHKTLPSIKKMQKYLPTLRNCYKQKLNYSQKPKGSRRMSNQIKKIIEQTQNQMEAVINNLTDKIRYYHQLEEMEEEQGKCEDFQQEVVNHSFYHRTQIEPQLLVSPMEQQQQQQRQENRKQDHSWPVQQQRYKEKLLKYNLFRLDDQQDEEQRMEIVILRETKDAKIKELVKGIDVTKIRELTIINDSTPCAIDQSIAEKIGEMTQLLRLRIFWARDLTVEMAIEMLQSLTKLQELCLFEFAQTTLQLVVALKENNPALQKLVFSADLKHCMRYTDEFLEFLPYSATPLAQEAYWFNLSTDLLNLTTIELNQPVQIEHWTQFLRHKQKVLKEFTLQVYKVSQDESAPYKFQGSDYNLIVKALGDCTQLQCLKLQQVSFQNRYLETILFKNNNLLSLCLNECLVDLDPIISSLSKNCPRIQELAIQLIDSFSGKNLDKLTSLKSLVVRACWYVKQSLFIKGVQKLKKLKYLSIDYCYTWVTNKSLTEISKLPRLKVLNIAHNHLHTIQPLYKMTGLKTLICWDNYFSYNVLYEGKFAKTLKRLSMSKNVGIYPAQKNQLQSINMGAVANHFPALSHLKLKGFKNIKPEEFGSMSLLNCVTLQQCLVEEVQKVEGYCQNKGINFNLCQ